MPKPYKGKIALDIRDSVPDWSPYLAPAAPEGSPNVLFIAWDDVGYGTMDVFGGPVETPTMRRLANLGVRYSNFHTTALCSPTRSSLLTGRNATSNGMATIAEFSSGFPGISTRIPFENGFISDVLAEQGYNTYCVEPPGTPEDGYHLSKDLSDKAIEFIRDAKIIGPDKPFFMYLAPQAGHAPHHVFQEWADKYKGRFDQGYEAIRPGILARQKELGILPEDTDLTAINPHGEPTTTGPDGQPWPTLDTVRPWDSLNADEKRLFARMAEVFAGYISYADDQLGRILDYLEESGQMDNTIVVVISDNGASGEGGPNGSFNEWRFFNGVPDTTEAVIPRIDELGTPSSYNHYNTGWAWAFDTPFPYWKRWAGYEGGVADICMVAWPAKVKASKEVRHQYIHAVDVVPTLYELLGIEPPAVLKGYTQNPIEGESFAAALTNPSAPGKKTQFYAMLGQRSIYDQGWLACSMHPPISGWSNFDKDEWELYHLESDRAQSKNVAADEPERLQRLKDLWFYYAGIYNGLPLDDRLAIEMVLAERPKPGPDRQTYTYYPDTADVPESAGVAINGRSFTISAGVDVKSADAEGVLYAHGGVAGGHSLYLKDRKLRYAFNWLGANLQNITGDADITVGRHVYTVDFVSEGPSTDAAMPGFTGTATLYIDDQVVGSGKVVTQPGPFCLIGDGICVGRDSASPVTPDYGDRGTFAFSGGSIDKVIVDVSGERFIDHEATVRGWFIKD